MGVPYVSGNVSFYNETPDGYVPPTPTVLGVGIVEDVGRCVTSDFKKDGNPVFLVGKTGEELGGSEYLKLRCGSAKKVPGVDFGLLKKATEAVVRSIEEGYVASCHDLAEGGLAVCAAEMAIGGDMGAELDVSSIDGLRSDAALFSESNTRWLVEVHAGTEDRFGEIMADVPVTRLGITGGSSIRFTRGGNALLDVSVDGARKAWSGAIQDIMG
jgi:phosphoribosylformylglycinamidine synthase